MCLCHAEGEGQRQGTLVCWVQLWDQCWDPKTKQTHKWEDKYIKKMTARMIIETLPRAMVGPVGAPF